MIVSATEDIHDEVFGRVNAKSPMIVFAKEERGGSTFYYLMAYGKPRDDDQLDPLFFPAKYFQINFDAEPKSWITKKVSMGKDIATISSFPEWFEGDFYLRAHDWGLEEGDYSIVKKYKAVYESEYERHLRTQG